MEQIEEQFEAVLQAGAQGIHYLDTAAMSQTPRVCTSAMHSWYSNLHSNVHRSFHAAADQSTEQYEAARTAVQRFIHAAHTTEVVFTKNCTEAMNLFAHSWGLQNIEQNDTIAITIAEHHSSIVPWQKVAERTGCNIEWIPITDEGYTDQKALQEILKNKPVKAVVHTGLSNVLGVQNDVAAITKLAHEHDALSIIDVAQLIAHNTVDVQTINCDALVFSGYKLYGPTGIGVLYAKQELLADMPSFLGGGMMITKVDQDGYTDAEVPHRFEAGTPPIAEAIGLKATIDWLQTLDREAIHAHEQHLLHSLQSALQNLPGIALLGGTVSRSNCVSFTHTTLHAHDLADLLGQAGIAVRAGNHCCQPLHTNLNTVASVRASVGMYTTQQDIEACILALQTILNKL